MAVIIIATLVWVFTLAPQQLVGPNAAVNIPNVTGQTFKAGGGDLIFSGDLHPVTVHGYLDQLVPALRKRGLKRMFLHAARLSLQHPETGQAIEFASPLPADLERFAATIRAESAAP